MISIKKGFQVIELEIPFFECLLILFNNIRIHQNPPAMLANDNFLSLTDFQLLLGGNFVKTSSARVSLNHYYCQTIASIGSDFIVSNNKSPFDNLGSL